MSTYKHNVLASVKYVLLLIVSINSAPAIFAQDTAILIGNSKYGHCSVTTATRCATALDCPAGETCEPTNGLPPLPGDLADLIRKHNAFQNAGWTIVNHEDLTKAEMRDAIDDIPNLPTNKKVILWFSGHGGAGGNLVGVDGVEYTVANLIADLGAAADRTLLKLDSCGSGAFAAAADAAAGAEPNGLGHITATAGAGCTPAGAGGAGSPFTTCFVKGLNGAADTNEDGIVTAKEAGIYAKEPCGGAYDDNDTTHDNWELGNTKVDAGCCVLPGGIQIQNISQAACEEKGGKWNAKVCVPTVSEWGLVVMCLMMLTAGTIVVRRRQYATSV